MFFLIVVVSKKRGMNEIAGEVMSGFSRVLYGAHVRRSLQRHSWNLRYRIRNAQLTNCTQRFFFQRTWSRLAQPGGSALTPIEIRRRSFRKTNTPFFACRGMFSSLRDNPSLKIQTSVHSVPNGPFAARGSTVRASNPNN